MKRTENPNMKNTAMEHDRETVDGKPHFGEFFGICALVSGDAFFGNEEDNLIVSIVKQKLESSAFGKLPEHFEKRHVTFIVRPPCYSDPFHQNGSVAIKLMIWGRAFHVKKLLKKGVKRYKKKRINGRRKTRVDIE